MAIAVKSYNDNAIVYDTGRNLDHRWYDAFGPDVTKFDQTYAVLPLISADNIAGWTSTLVEAGASESTVALANERGGALLITTDQAENDGVNLQSIGETFKLDGPYPLYFGAKIKMSDATQSNFIIGLCITDTTLIGGMTDGVYFRKLDGTTTMYFVAEKDSVESTTAVATATTNWMWLEFTWDGTRINAYVDGVLAATCLTGWPDDEELCLSVAFTAGEAASKSLRINQWRAIQINV